MSDPSPPASPFDAFRHVCDFAGINEALRSPADLQRPRPHADPLEADTLFKLSGDRHRARRKLETKLFKPAALEATERDVLRPAINDVMLELSSQRHADGLVRSDLVVLSRRMVMPVTATIIGLDGVDSVAETEELFGMLV